MSMEIASFGRIKVYKCKSGYIIHNTEYPFNTREEKWHTHINKKGMALIIAKNVYECLTPKTRNYYLLISHIRLSDNEEYIAKIQHLIDVHNRNKKNKFHNRGGRKVG